jgi:hypothetical protein
MFRKFECMNLNVEKVAVLVYVEENRNNWLEKLMRSLNKIGQFMASCPRLFQVILKSSLHLPWINNYC